MCDPTGAIALMNYLVKELSATTPLPRHPRLFMHALLTRQSDGMKMDVRS